jgi:GTP-binding protein Era
MSSKPPTYSPPTSVSNSPPTKRCGYVALVGRPNAGKSTLFNAFLGQRLSIVTAKPQTTRNRILGILTQPQSQMIFLDTPGLLDPSYKLHEDMEASIDLASREADAVILLADATRLHDRDNLVRAFIARNRTPLVAVLNKTDLLPPDQVQNAKKAWIDAFGLVPPIPISALTGDQIDVLLAQIEQLMPVGPQLYPDDMIAEQPERFFVSELIREAAFSLLSDELPYALNVEVEEFVERRPKTFIRAVLHVERESQKGIVIGKKGSLLRQIGAQARPAIESFIQAPVYLELWVKVRPDWRNKERALREFGYR